MGCLPFLVHSTVFHIKQEILTFSHPVKLTDAPATSQAAQGRAQKLQHGGVSLSVKRAGNLLLQVLHSEI